MRKFIGCGVFVLFAALNTFAEPVMPTRELGVLSRREHLLDEALKQGDLSEINNILSRKFDVRYASHPAKPIDQTVWLKDLDLSQFPGKTSEWSVFSDGVTAWVSYLWAPKEGGATVWVMDQWDGIDDNAHLLHRFYAPAKDVRALKKE